MCPQLRRKICLLETLAQRAYQLKIVLLMDKIQEIQNYIVKLIEFDGLQKEAQLKL